MQNSKSCEGDKVVVFCFSESCRTVRDSRQHNDELTPELPFREHFVIRIGRVSHRYHESMLFGVFG